MFFINQVKDSPGSLGFARAVLLIVPLILPLQYIMESRLFRPPPTGEPRLRREADPLLAEVLSF